MYLTANLISSLLYFCLFIYTCKSANEGPVSVTTLEGLTAQFHCTGSGSVLVWEVNGSAITESNREITHDTVASSSGTIQSTLTVSAIIEINGTTVRCYIGPSLISLTVVGNSSTLTILTNIGQVINLELESSILWDPPATAGVLNLLFSYNVIVTNMNTSDVIVSDTTNITIYPLPQLQSCQYYTANVTVFYKDHFGDSVVTGQKIPDEYFKLHNLFETKIVRRNESYSDVTFITNITGSNMSCPGQKLMAVTYPISNSSDTTMHKEGTIEIPGEMEFTVSVKQGFDCACNVLIVTKNSSQVDEMKTNFSTFDVQSCTVSSDHNSIVLRCTFVINSTAPGYVVVKNRISGETVRERNYRDPGDYPKSITISDLQAGDYTVFVYDQRNQTRLAYNESLHITSDGLGSNSVNTSSPTPTLSITTPIADSSFVGVIAGAVVVVAAILLVILSALIYLYVRKKHRQKTTPMNEKRRTNNANIYSDENELRRVTVRPINEEHMTLGESNYMQTPKEFLSTANVTSTDHEKKSDPLYADLQHPSNRPAASVSVGASQYAVIQQQQQSGLHYAEVQHFKNRPAAAASVEPVQYATTVQAQSNKEVSQNICAANTSGYASEETISRSESGSGSSVSSEAKSEATSSTGLSSGQESDPADADGSYIQVSEDCNDYGNNTLMVNEQTLRVVEEYVPADTRQHSGSLSLDTMYSDTVPLSLDETTSDNPSRPVYTTSKNFASKRNDRDMSPTDYSYISDEYKTEKTTYKSGRNYAYHRLPQYN